MIDFTLCNQLAPDEAYLSFYDVRLTKGDVMELKNGWFNDNHIAFWEEYLEREYLSRFENSRIILLRPTMSLMLKLSSHPMDVKDALPDFTGASHVFIPVNDCSDANEVEGGSHWSLLLVSITDGVAFHYDSMGAGNREHAFRLSKRLATLLGRPLSYLELNDSPQQENGSDCGVFVCLNMRHLLLKRLLMVKTSEKVSMSMADHKLDAREGRKETLKLIEHLRREGERRRSSPHHGKSTPPRIDSPSTLET